MLLHATEWIRNPAPTGWQSFKIPTSPYDEKQPDLPDGTTAKAQKSKGSLVCTRLLELYCLSVDLVFLCLNQTSASSAGVMCGLCSKICAQAMLPYSIRTRVISSFGSACAGSLRLYILYRLFLAWRAYRLFPCLEPTHLGFMFRTNNFIESYHKTLKYFLLR